jgi:hypothetical protein
MQAVEPYITSSVALILVGSKMLSFILRVFLRVLPSRIAVLEKLVARLAEQLRQNSRNIRIGRPLSLKRLLHRPTGFVVSQSRA